MERLVKECWNKIKHVKREKRKNERDIVKASLKIRL